MMERYLLDTNIFTFMATNDYDSLTRDVKYYMKQGLDLIYNKR